MKRKSQDSTKVLKRPTKFNHFHYPFEKCVWNFIYCNAVNWCHVHFRLTELFNLEGKSWKNVNYFQDSYLNPAQKRRKEKLAKSPPRCPAFHIAVCPSHIIPFTCPRLSSPRLVKLTNVSTKIIQMCARGLPCGLIPSNRQFCAYLIDIRFLFPRSMLFQKYVQ